MQPLSETEEKYIKGWSWGAFFGLWVFLFVNKQNKLAWKILAVFIVMILLGFAPVLNIVADDNLNLRGLSNYQSVTEVVYIGLTIWGSIRGREMVWKSGVFSTVGDFQLKQKLVTKVNIFVIMAIIVIFIFLFVLFQV